MHSRSSLAGGSHTLFLPATSPASARKQWLAGALDVRGRLRVDAGAEKALRGGSSLLPVGIVAVDGDFARGDAVSICGPEGNEIGRGLVAYRADETARIKGRRSAEIEAVLGYLGRSVVIHRDDMVLFEAQ